MTTTRAAVLDRDTTTSDRALRIAAIAFLAAFALHTFDHLRRDPSTLTTTLQVAGNASSVVSVVVIVAVLTRRRWAPLVAGVAGLVLAAGFASAHLLPTWSELSDSFPVQDVGAFTWFAASAEIATAAILGVVGLRLWWRPTSRSTS